jgi:pimeloyl-ACP methyl ester carboxylesterase
LPLYDGWHAYFKKYQPRMLITWGTNDVFFPVPGAKAYLRDLPQAELHLIETGHFALEDNCAFIAGRIRKFFA